MEKSVLDIANIRGKEDDGCSSMSSNATGVQAIIKKDFTKAVYKHCSSSCLNLMVAKSCKANNAIRNQLG